MIGKICGTGSYVPSNYLDNNDLAKLVETSDEWIRERTGVVKRHIVEEDTTVSMAVEASKRALEDSKISAEKLDMILFATMSSNVVLPCAACEVQSEIGAMNAVCFDLNAACSGFLFALNTAQAYISAGMCETVLIIGAESLSNLVNWEDRGTCILFGDGAGAAVVCAQEGVPYQSVSYSDGVKGAALTCHSRYVRGWEEREKNKENFIWMDGQAVFKFAVRKVPECISEVLEKNDLQAEDIDCFVLHQANRRIVESVAKKLKVEVDKFPMNLQEYGNTSAASIPILLDELHRTNQIKRGQKLVVSGFGAGLSWGATIIEW